MVSSAIYRYFPSRDDLLTALIVDGYNAIGEVAEQADAAGPAGGTTPGAGWLSAGPSGTGPGSPARVRAGLRVAGAGLPGAAADHRARGPGGRGVREDHQRGLSGRARFSLPGICPPPPEFVHRGRGSRCVESVLPGVPDDAIAVALATWTALFGMISFELFGQFENVITDRAAFFGHAMACQGRLAGLPG